MSWWELFGIGCGIELAVNQGGMIEFDDLKKDLPSAAPLRADPQSPAVLGATEGGYSVDTSG